MGFNDVVKTSYYLYLVVGYTNLIISLYDSQQAVKVEPENGDHRGNKGSSQQNEERLPLNVSNSARSDDKISTTTEEVSLISFDETTENPPPIKLIRQPSPPPVLAQVQDLIPAVSPQVSEPDFGLDSLPDEALRAENPLQLHIVRLSYTVSN